MSKRYNNGSHYENHQRAAELHEAAAHAHLTAEQHAGQQDHPTGHERSRQALEHSGEAHRSSLSATTGHGIHAFNHEEIAILAHELWEARGDGEGSAQEDWFHAVKQLRSQTATH
jgi:hypothetical protein